MIIKKSHGFTLLEILLVVGIIAILAAIVIIAINPTKQLATTRNTERQSDIKQIYNAVNQYFIDHHRFPSGISGSLKEICDTGEATSAPEGGFCDGLVDLSLLVPKYLTAIPKDPHASESVSVVPKVYATTNGTGYRIKKTDSKIVVVTAPYAELSAIISIPGNVSDSIDEDVDVYTVTYNANGGEGTPPTDTNEYELDEQVSIANNTNLTKGGYIFDGWNTQADGGGSHYNEGEIMNIGNSNLVLYAVWEDDGILEWGAFDNGGPWSYAVDFCVAQGAGWRLPSIDELINGMNAQIVNGIFYDGIFRNQLGYWSITESYSNNSMYAYAGSDNIIHSSSYNRGQQFAIRCIR